MKKITILLSLLLSYVSMLGQQLPLSNHTIIHNSLISPGYLSGEDGMSAFASSQAQYFAFDGVARLSQFQFQAKSSENSGLGFYLYSKDEGVWNSTGVKLNYARLFKINNKQSITFAFGGSYLGSKLDQSALVLKDNNDALLNSNVLNGRSVGLEFGLLYKLGIYDIGISMPNLWQAKIDYAGSDSEYQLAPVFQSHVAADYTLNDNFMIRPMVLAQKSSMGPVQIGASVLGTYKEKLNLGVFYRSQTNAGVLLGYEINKTYLLNYSYSNGFNSIMKSNHELSLLIDIGVLIRNRNGKTSRELEAEFTSQVDSLEGIIDGNKSKLRKLEASKSEEQTKRKELDKTVDSLDAIIVRHQERIKELDSMDIKVEKHDEVMREEFGDHFGEGIYIVLKSYESSSDAIIYQESWKKRGVNTTILRSASKTWYYVVTKSFKTKEETLEYLKELNGKHKLDNDIWLYGLKK